MIRKASEIVLELSQMASMGKYDGITPERARRMNALFVEVAALVNRMEEAEKDAVNSTVVEETDNVRETK